MIGLKKKQEEDRLGRLWRSVHVCSNAAFLLVEKAKQEAEESEDRTEDAAREYQVLA